MDGTTVLVALVALCVVNLVLIWQVATLIGRVDDVQEDMHATASHTRAGLRTYGRRRVMAKDMDQA